jgi:hypothetical protein
MGHGKFPESQKLGEISLYKHGEMLRRARPQPFWTQWKSIRPCGVFCIGTFFSTNLKLVWK